MDYSNEEKSWIINNAKNYSNFNELADAFIKTFNSTRTKSAIVRKCNNMGVRLNNKYTAEQKQWIEENSMNYTREELHKEFNKKFNEHKTKNAICHQAVSKHLKSKGNKYTKKYKLGDEMLYNHDHHKYIMVKISEGKTKKNWKRKDFIEWEKYHQPVKKDEYLIHLDGYIENCDIDNLYLCNGSVYKANLDKFKILERHNKYLTLCVIKTLEHNSLVKNKSKNKRIKIGEIL